MNDEIKLRWSDVWLLLAIFYAKNADKKCLSSVIATADYINHAVINYEELASGLNRLSKSGLIAVNQNLSSFECLDKALIIIEPIVKRTKNAYEARKEIELKINSVPWVPRDPLPHPNNNLEFPSFTREVYQAAVDEYLKSTKSKS